MLPVSPRQTRLVLERDIQRGCLEWLSAKGVLSWRSNQIPVPLKDGGFRKFAGLKGVADILGIVRQDVMLLDRSIIPMGVFLAVEVKGPKGKLSEEQEWFLEEVRRRGGIGLCVRSVDDLEAQLTPFLWA